MMQMGEEMVKAPNMDTFKMTRAMAILRQSDAARRRMVGGRASPGGVDLTSSAGRPSKPDGKVDPITRRTNSGQLQSGNPSTLG
jgi:hypothetical protein